MTSINSGGLKSYVKTRWTTAYDCINSILNLESVLTSVSNCIYLLLYLLLLLLDLN